MSCFAAGEWASDPIRQKARKEHTCDRCLGVIQPGATYLRWCWVGEGTARTMRSHGLCEKYGLGSDDDGYIDPFWGWSELLDGRGIRTPDSWDPVNPSVFHDELVALLGGG